MLAYNMITVYADLFEMGLVRNKREFSRRYLKRGQTYLRDLERVDRDRSAVRIPASTVTALRGQLSAIERFGSRRVQAEIKSILVKIDEGVRVADLLGYR